MRDKQNWKFVRTICFLVRGSSHNPFSTPLKKQLFIDAMSWNIMTFWLNISVQMVLLFMATVVPVNLSLIPSVFVPTMVVLYVATSG